MKSYFLVDSMFILRSLGCPNLGCLQITLMLHKLTMLNGYLKFQLSCLAYLQNLELKLWNCEQYCSLEILQKIHL